MSGELGEWAPYRLDYRDQWQCRWFSRAGLRYEEPFFQETVLRCLGQPQNAHGRASISSLDFLDHAASLVNPVKPTAFIFHVSRCGSTLLAQLLGLDPHNIVLSEARLIDELLGQAMKSTLPHDQAAPMLQSAIALLGNRRFGEERLFIKLDSWHIHHAGLLHRLYPDTPFILLARAPQEILRSQRIRRGTHAVPGLLDPALFGMQHEEAEMLDADDYLGRVLAYYYARFAELAEDGRNLLLDYGLGARESMVRLARHLAMDVDAPMWVRIDERCRYHSKRPEDSFSELPLQEDLPSCLKEAEAQYRRLGF